METSIYLNSHVKNIAIFIPGRLYRNYSIYKDQYTPKYDFTFLKILKDFYKYHNINIYFFASLSKDCDIPIITNEFINLMEISNDRINMEEIVCPSIIYCFSKRPETNYENTYKMFYHNLKCYQLIEQYSKIHNIVFDVLIKWRTDISIKQDCIQFFMEKIIEDFMQIKDNNNLYVPSHDLFWGINDQLAYGNYNCMQKYCNMVKKIIGLCKKGVVYHPETLLLQHCYQSNIMVNTFDLSYNLL
jgi:hypothetical protein